MCRSLQQQVFLIVLGKFAALEIRILRFTVRTHIIRTLLGRASDLLAERGIYGHRCLTVFTLDKTDKLVVLVSVVSHTLAAVESQSHGLRAYNLAGGSHQRY